MQNMNDVASRLRRNLGLASLSAMAVMMATPALAQTEDAAAQDGETATTPTPAHDDSIVVTGSRISGVTPFNSPDPHSVISPALAATEGTRSEGRSVGKACVRTRRYHGQQEHLKQKKDNTNYK